MRIETIGGRSVAFGLTWVAGEDSTESVLSAAFGFDAERPRHVYLAHASNKGDEGTVGVATAPSKLPGRVYSAAAAIATLGKDGLFVLQLAADEALWFCGIQNGAVIAGTDLVMSPEEGAAQIIALADGLELPVFVDSALAGSQLAGLFDSSEALEISGVLGHAQIKPLASPRGKSVLLLPVIIIAVAAIGFFAFHSHQAAAPPADAQAIRQQKIQAYVSQASSAIGSLPEDGDWALAAFARARNALPPFIAGWELDTVDCLPSACHAKYMHRGEDGYALSPLNALFGEHNVEMTSLGRTVEVTLPIKAPTAEVDEGWLRSLQPATTPFADWLGRVPEVMGGGKVSGRAVALRLDKKNHGDALGMPPLMVEQAAVSASAYLDAATLAGIVRQGSMDGFRVVRLTWAPSIEKPSWQIAWERVHG